MCMSVARITSVGDIVGSVTKSTATVVPTAQCQICGVDPSGRSERSEWRVGSAP